MQLLQHGGVFVRLTVGLLAAVGIGCGSAQPSELSAEGPPRVLQVVVSERVVEPALVDNVLTVQRRLAFGDHPQVPTETDDRQVTNALPHRQRIRVVVDELLLGNNLEELACADGITYSRIPLGTTPDDIAKCSGSEESLEDCTGDNAVCQAAEGPIGILDESPRDGVADDFRLISSVAEIVCAGESIPIDLDNSFYQPSGNQQISAVGIDSLGPAIVLVPGVDGLPTRAVCGIRFSSEVVDKDGEVLCLQRDGDCTLDNIQEVQFTVDQLGIDTSSPADGETAVPPVPEMGEDSVITVQFNAVIDASTTAALRLFESASMAEVAVTRNLSPEDAGIVQLVVPGGYAPNTGYVLEIQSGDGGVKDRYGGALVDPVSIGFTTGS